MPPSPTTGVPADFELARRIAAGDRAAFDAFYEVYFPRVHAFARRRARDRAEAEDWTQDALVEVLRALPGYRGDAPLGAFVFAIVRRVVARGRRGPPASLSLDAAADAPCPASSPESRAHAGALLRRALVVWARAGDRARRALALRHGDGLSVRQIAERTGASEAAVKTTLSRAQRRLAALLAARATSPR